MSFKAIKSGWRPAFGWVFVLFFAGLSIVLLVSLSIGAVAWEDVSGTINTMVGAGGLVTGSYVAGRSYEKSIGKSTSEYEMPEQVDDY